MTEVRLKNYRFDPANPPDLTAEQQEELEALQKMTDENIDFSDIPATSEEDWKNAVVGKFHQTSKKCDDDFLTDRPDVISDEGRFSWIMINHEVLLDFSLGRITDLDVMDILGLDSEEDLFLLMAKHDFPMPKLATTDTQKMVSQLNNIMKIY